MALCSIGTKVNLVKGESQKEEIRFITSIPSLGAVPESLDTTCLTDAMRTSVHGVQQLEDLTFEAIYDTAEFKKVWALNGTAVEIEVAFNDGLTVTIKGQMAVVLGGVEVNDTYKYSFTITPSEAITVNVAE